jgi:hypothetical protein
VGRALLQLPESLATRQSVCRGQGRNSQSNLWRSPGELIKQTTSATLFEINGLDDVLNRFSGLL